MTKQRKQTKTKTSFHPRNKHQGRYDFKALVAACPELSPFVILNKYRHTSIDFANPKAVKILNKALLAHYYGIKNWSIPQGYLCPPIPSRSDYIHHIADLLATSNDGNIPQGQKIRCLDVGVGANCIYPIIGTQEYDWSFVGSDIDTVAIKAAQAFIESNAMLSNQIELCLQQRTTHIFKDIISKGEYFDMTICNPPFHASLAEAKAGSLRKLSNLNQRKIENIKLNFGGQANELWCEGGELTFIKNMIYESKIYRTSCFWFSTLVAQQVHLKAIYKILKEAEVEAMTTIPMKHGNKQSRIVTWTFLTEKQQKIWKKTRF